jgi:hypothetical protein
MKTKRWNLRTGSISKFVNASDQWEAFDSLRNLDRGDFGLIVVAEANESGDDDSIPCRTSLLMRRWNRDGDAMLFARAMVEAGYPDTNAADVAATKGAP